MPGLLKKDEQGDAAQQGGEAHAASENVSQPTSLQGLLRFAMETTGSEDAGAAGPSVLGPIDEEKRKFLEDALKSMTIDVIELLLKQIKVFDNVGTVTVDGDVTDYAKAFDTILDYVNNIDVANDFHKIGGFMIFNPCLRCVHPKIRARACELLAELCQNNPYCQNVVTENDFIPLLVNMLDQDEDEVCVKALYAISAIVRDNEDGFQVFLAQNGLDTVFKTIKKNDEKLRIKSSFFLCAVCQMQEDLKAKLISMGFLQVLMSILSEERAPSHEHILSLLKYFVEENDAVIQVCRDPQYNLQRTLVRNVEATVNKEEFYEEHEYSRELLNQLFPGWSN